MDGEVKPVMSGRLLDESHWLFHVVNKSKIIGAIRQAAKGYDFLKALGTMESRPEWVDPSENNVRMLLEILDYIVRNDPRPNRRELIDSLGKTLIGYYQNDLFWRERGEGLLFLICQNSHRFVFHKRFIDPENWYPRGRRFSNQEHPEQGVDWLEQEMKAPPIEDEYLEWYGVDIRQGQSDSDQKEMRIQQHQVYRKDWQKIGKEGTDGLLNADGH